jgi:hypothetical protein
MKANPKVAKVRTHPGSGTFSHVFKCSPSTILNALHYPLQSWHNLVGPCRFPSQNSLKIWYLLQQAAQCAWIEGRKLSSSIISNDRLTLSRPPATIVEHALDLQIPAVLTQKTSRYRHYRCYTKTWDHTATLWIFWELFKWRNRSIFIDEFVSGGRNNRSHTNSSLFRQVSMAERLERTGDPWSIPGAAQIFV